MAKFSSPERQAASVMKELQGSTLRSVGTVRNYEQGLKQAAQWSQNQGSTLRDLTTRDAERYLSERAQDVGQKSLDMSRQAIQAMMQNVTHRLATNERLSVIKSEQEQALHSRAYTSEQVQLVAQAQTEPHRLATEIAHAAGLRAHELYTLQPMQDRQADPRPTLDSKFQGREGLTYTVTGKGGLVREVQLPSALAERLESARLPTPQIANDRGVIYEQHYRIGAGQSWSQSFGSAAQHVLGWSEGAHGVRHSYAQERISELQAQGYTYRVALTTVSQEMGHFRAEITEVYLR